MSLGDLAQVLRQLNESGTPNERLLVGTKTFDDAGVFALDAGRALVQTVDFFPPIVDDPYAFGQIAAANALSDVYAMGGRPLTVLNIAGFPKEIEPEWIAQIFQGAAEKVREAGAVVAGGHTIRTGGEVLFGLSVTGEVHPAKITANTNAKPGDLLYLSKPLGMGAATTAMKKEKISAQNAQAAQEQMAILNAAACDAMQACGVRAATDITGYGLLGHARNIARASGVTMLFEAKKIPIFPPSLELAREGLVSGAVARNKGSFANDVQLQGGVDPAISELCFDSETSGGLLVCVAQGQAKALESEFKLRKVSAVLVGEVTEKREHWIVLQ